MNYLVSSGFGLQALNFGYHPRLEFGVDTAFHFVSMKMTEEILEYTVIDSTGKTIDSGSIPRVQSAAAGGTLR